MTKVTIRSATFPQSYLCLNGTGVTNFGGNGRGTVNCQAKAGAWEVFELEHLESQPGGAVAIKSTAFPNVYLSMDASSLRKSSDNHGGVVNCQVGAGSSEKFRLESQPDGTTAIASLNSPGTYLRMDGTLSNPNIHNFGIVNSNSVVGPWEKFIVSNITEPLTRAELENAITTYGPILQLHPNEIYNNCSIEYFLENCSLIDSKTGLTIARPTMDQLPQSPAEDGRYWLELQDTAKGGDFTIAKAYVHALWQQGLTYTDLQFWFFSAYNGPGTAHINGLLFDTVTHSGDVDLAPLGEHYGDWEYCVIRIDNTTKKMIGIRLSQHSGSQVFNEDQLSAFRMARDTHPVIYSSRNGHANYSTADSNFTEHHKIPSPAIPAGVEFFLRNDTSDGGKSLDCSQHYQIITASWLTGDNAYPVPKWVNYPYRWGPEGTSTHITPKIVEGILTAALGSIGGVVPQSVVHVLGANILPLFVKDDVNGPGAPITHGAWIGNY